MKIIPPLRKNKLYISSLYYYFHHCFFLHRAKLINYSPRKIQLYVIPVKEPVAHPAALIGFLSVPTVHLTYREDFMQFPVQT